MQADFEARVVLQRGMNVLYSQVPHQSELRMKKCIVFDTTACFSPFFGISNKTCLFFKEYIWVVCLSLTLHCRCCDVHTFICDVVYCVYVCWIFPLRENIDLPNQLRQSKLPANAHALYMLPPFLKYYHTSLCVFLTQESFCLLWI